MLIGVWVMIILFLGFPGSWEKALLLATGVALVAIGYRMPAPAPKQRRDREADKPFVDSAPQAPSAPAVPPQPIAPSAPSDANPSGPAGTAS